MFGKRGQAVGRSRGVVEMHRVGRAGWRVSWKRDLQNADHARAGNAGNAAVQPGADVVGRALVRIQSWLTQTTHWQELDWLRQGRRAVQRLHRHAQSEHANRIAAVDL